MDELRDKLREMNYLFPNIIVPILVPPAPTTTSGDAVCKEKASMNEV